MATIKDVARTAGVSISTVSKYMNGGNVRPEYAEPIRQAIAQLDYRVNPCARNLKSPRSRSIGVLIPSIRSPSSAPSSPRWTRPFVTAATTPSSAAMTVTTVWSGTISVSCCPTASTVLSMCRKTSPPRNMTS